MGATLGYGRDVHLIGVPFDGYGRPGNQALAASALREAGLGSIWDDHRVVADDDVLLPPPSRQRGPSTTLINEAALLGMVDVLGANVADTVRAGRFPFVFGGDCTTLLATIPALRAEGVGLLFLDGHEDTMPLDVSEDGEAANAEIGLLLGLTGRQLIGPLADRLPALDTTELALLGQRDDEWRRRFNVGSLRDHGVWMQDHREVALDPTASARDAIHHLRQTHARWWLHVDIDVLDPEVFGAQGLPEVPDEPGGLTWQQLQEVLTTALNLGGCVGFSVAIYDPDQDPDREQAGQIVDMLAAAAAALQ